MRTPLRTAAAFLAGAVLTGLVFAFHPEPGEAIRNIAHPPPAEARHTTDLSSIVRVKRDDGGFDHFLGPHISIDREWVKHSLSFEGPKVRILVDADGKVTFAQARSGPKETQREAERLVRQVRFIPFRRNGKRVPAVIEEFSIRVRHQPEERPDYKTPFPPIKDWSTLHVAIQHWEDRGGSYRLTIDGTGRVIFESDDAAVRGKHVATISKRELQELVDAFRRADWFSTLDQYRAGATHQDIALTQLQFDGRHKPVFYHPGPHGTHPDAIRDVHAAILRVTNANRWLNGNEATGPSLVAEKWDFKAKSPANLSLLSGIAAHGDIRALKDIGALGAPVITDTKPYPAPTPAIVPAAGRADVQILQHLLSLDARWDQESLDAALLNAAQDGNAAAVHTLLTKGANPRAATKFEGVSALMTAAKAGSHGAVAALIAKAASRDGGWYDSLFGSDDLSPKRDEIEKARIAAAAKVFVTTRDRNGATALHALVGLSSPLEKPDARGVARMLIKHGAIVDARDKYGRTPLIEAGLHPDVASELISAGADVNARDNNGQTPLMNSYEPWLTHLLLQRGADINARDNEGRSALDRSKEYGGSDTTPVLEWWLAKSKAHR